MGKIFAIIIPEKAREINMEQATPILAWGGQGGGPYNCSLCPGYQLRKVAQPGWPRYWLITSDDEVPKVKANLGDCELSTAKLRFVLWMEGKTWN